MKQKHDGDGSRLGTRHFAGASLLRALLWSLLGLFSGTSGAFDAIDTGLYFPAVAQGHHGDQATACTGASNPQLSEVNTPRINGTGGSKLAFCSITPNQNNTKNCDDGQGGYKVCAITGQDIRGLSLSGNNAFPVNGSTTDINCQNNGSAVLDKAAYHNVSSSGCQLTMVAQPRYQIASLNMSNGGTLTLGPGDHFFETLSLDNTIVKLQSPTQALTRIFVKNAPNLNNNLSINKDGKQNLIWVSYGDFAMQNGSFAGYLYAGGAVTLSNQATLTGRITARSLVVRDNSVINKGDAASLPDGCKDVFTDPPSEGAIMTPPPGVLVPPLGDLVCEKQGNGTNCTGHSSNRFVPGDHDFNNGSISNQAQIIATGVTARLYFNNLDLNNAELNPNSPPENLFIYVKGDLSIAGQNQINAVVYVAGSVKMAGNSSIDGALAAGGNIENTGNGDIDFSQDAVDKVDLGGVTCGGAAGGNQIDHFELTHSGQPLTCSPETVTIKACADAACSTLITEQVTATLMPETDAKGGWVGGNQVTFSGGTTQRQLRHNVAGDVTMGVSSSTPNWTHQTLCRAGAGTPSAAACTLNFADSGFVFDMPDTLANQPQQVQLKAVKKDDASQQCVPGFADVDKQVSFWSDYINPGSNPFGRRMTVNGEIIGIAQGATVAHSLHFNAEGATTLTVKYPDAGQMQLNARHDGSGDSVGLVMTGAEQFVSRPVGLCVTVPNGSCPAGNISCPLFKKAGERFPLEIQGVAWQSDNDSDLCSGNLSTPNFALANIALGSELVAPKPGGEARVETASYDHQIEASSNFNTIEQSLDEVGVFRLTATPPVKGYFGYTIPPAASVPVGRFVPWEFHLADSHYLTPACGAFSYMDQPFGVLAQLEAHNRWGKVTQNYQGDFAKGSVALVAANAKDGIDRSDRVTTPEANWSLGTLVINGQSQFARLNAADGPFRALRFGVRVLDNESPAVSFLADMDMNPALAGDCVTGVNCDARQLAIPQGPQESAELRDTMTAYYGRLLASTGNGETGSPLALALRTQYQEQGQWQLNSDDSCTALSLTNEGFYFTDESQHYDEASGDLSLNGTTKIHLGLGKVAPGGQTALISKGETQFHFAEPNMAVRIPYRISLTRQPLSLPWLADPATPGHLAGEAIFGNHRGNDRIIYRREVMP